jgi:hypothetical protein
MVLHIPSPWRTGPARSAFHPSSHQTRSRSTFPVRVRQRRSPLPRIVLQAERNSSRSPAESGCHCVRRKTTVSSSAGRREKAGIWRCASAARTAKESGTTSAVSDAEGTQNQSARCRLWPSLARRHADWRIAALSDDCRAGASCAHVACRSPLPVRNMAAKTTCLKRNSVAA